MSAAVSVTQLHRMAQNDDSGAKEILTAIGPLNGWRPWGQQVIGAIYYPPAKSGSILLPDHAESRSIGGTGGMTTHMSHRLEGKAFLLVAYGPSAFPDNLLREFDGARPEVGSWFFARPNDGVEISLDFGGVRSNRVEQRGWPCRIFLANDLMGPLPAPGCIV